MLISTYLHRELGFNPGSVGLQIGDRKAPFQVPTAGGLYTPSMLN